MKKFFDLRSFDGLNLAAFFLIFIVYSIMDFTVPDQYFVWGALATVVLNMGIILHDQKVLAANDVPNPPNAFWCLLMPVYMFKREKRAGKKNLNVAWAYLVILVIYLLASFKIDDAKNPDRVAADVCPVVDTIDVYRDANITCLRAYNFSEQYSGFWKGRVHLSNNMIVTVTADYNQEKDSVYVQTQGIAADAGY